MKNLRRLLPALCLLLISAMCAGTSTYAWFSMNNQVSATGMQVQAKADSGIVIKEAGTSNAFASTVAVAAGSSSLYPTSTVDFSTWQKGSSSSTSNALVGVTYENVTPAEETSYFKKFSFVIRSSASGTDVDNVKLAVSELNVTNSTYTSGALDKCLRVAVVCNGDYRLFAPMATADVSYNPVYASQTNLNAYKDCSSAVAFTLNENKVPASDTGITVDVYLYFEGEDAACISDNITATLDNLDLTIAFKAVANS